MNSKELIKKIDIGRVGNGTQTYNDMCLILNKEETLELLQYIEKLENKNQELKDDNSQMQGWYDCYFIENEKLEKENKELKEKTEKIIDELIEHEQKTFRKYAKCKRALDILKEKLDIKLEVYHCGGCTLNHKIIPNCVTPNERCLRYLEVEEYELLKSVLEEE